MMKPDSMLVDVEYISQALAQIAGAGLKGELEDLQRREPALAAFVEERLASLVGRLTLCGVPGRLVRNAHAEVLEVLLTSVRALQRGHYELWKDLMAPPGESRRGKRSKRRPKRPPEMGSSSDDLPF